MIITIKNKIGIIMFKRILSLAIVALTISSCGNKTNKEVSTTDQVMDVQFASLVDNPGNYIDKNIKVEGKVVHVCTESGKKLFISGENPDIMLYVAAGENNPKFPMELLGTKVSVEGRLTRVVTAEKPVEEPVKMAMTTPAGCPFAGKEGAPCADSTAKTAAECETEAALAKQVVLADLMMIYNKHTLVK